MERKPTHIQVTDAKGHPDIENGQMLQVVRETPCFFWVKSFSGTNFQVSKKTRRIIGTKATFLRTSKQPTMNF